MPKKPTNRLDLIRWYDRKRQRAQESAIKMLMHTHLDELTECQREQHLASLKQVAGQKAVEDAVMDWYFKWAEKGLEAITRPVMDHYYRLQPMDEATQDIRNRATVNNH